MKRFRVRFYKHTTTADRHAIEVNAETPEEARAKVEAWGKGEVFLDDAEEETENLEREGEVIDSEFNALEDADSPYAVVELIEPADYFIARSSYADIYCDKQTGAVVKRDYGAMGGTNQWEDVQRFDPATFNGESENDVLRVGYWTKDGRYWPPVSEEVLRG